MKKHVPTTTKSNKMLTLNDKTWISRAIKRSYKIRNKIYKQYCKEKDQAKKTSWNSLKHTGTTVVLTRISREDYYIKYSEANKDTNLQINTTLQA